MKSLFQFAAPARFYPIAGKLVPLFGFLAAGFALAGLILGLVIAPADFQQGQVYRIIFIHVPAAWMAMFVYLVMAAYAIVTLVWRTRLSAMMTQALAPTGALFAALALWTGALWGQPTWGTWWAWDARMTSTLILLFLYLGYIALDGAIADRNRAERAGALLLLVGSINVPIIYFSVQWWNTLHQGSSIKMNGTSMAGVMVLAMLLMSFAAWFYTIAVAMARVRTLILLRERDTQWVRAIVQGRSVAKPGTLHMEQSR